MKLVGRKFNNARLNINISVYNIDGKNWFIGKDIANELGYKDTTQAIAKSVSEHRKMKVYIETIENIENCPADSSEISTVNNNLLLINESGLYQLAIRSSKKEAEEFQDWICDEVLPSLRENNYYIDEDYISKEQIDKMREHLYFLCSEGKMSLGKASTAIFGDKKTLKKKLIERGWLDYENNTFQQQRMLNKDNEYFDLFVVSKVGSYENGNTKTQMQVSISNAGVVWLREKFRNA